MNQGNRITTILWDVDDTLLDFPYSQKYAISKCFHSIGREITEEMIERYSQINTSYWKRLELGEITRQELLPGRFLTLFEEYKIQGVNVEAFRAEYQEALGSVYSYLDDSLTICKSLQGCYKQYVVTNGVASTQRNKLKLSGLDEVMDGIFISEELGASKPSALFFDACLEQVMEKDRSRILLVGDSVSSDIKGGSAAGILTCWYHRTEEENPTQWQADYEIHDLHQIYDVLQVFEG